MRVVLVGFVAVEFAAPLIHQQVHLFGAGLFALFSMVGWFYYDL